MRSRLGPPPDAVRMPRNAIGVLAGGFRGGDVERTLHRPMALRRVPCPIEPGTYLSTVDASFPPVRGIERRFSGAGAPYPRRRKRLPVAFPAPISGAWVPLGSTEWNFPRGWGDSDRRLVRLDHPRRDRGDTGIGRAAKAACGSARQSGHHDRLNEPFSRQLSSSKICSLLNVPCRSKASARR
jgi:hypothetical protein